MMLIPLYKKRNFVRILIVTLFLLLIVWVWWWYGRQIAQLDDKRTPAMHTGSS